MGRSKEGSIRPEALPPGCLLALSLSANLRERLGEGFASPKPHRDIGEGPGKGFASPKPHPLMFFE
jgi:hypothetical protein